ncbi:hypothetical protein HDU86_000339 [Geranomyces michiganensis]|nr:hypothetical protein HDU86_000339 [Geranomyces michiganensis]
MDCKKGDDSGVAYTGFHPPSSAWSPARIDPAAISPHEFFATYIATRTPVVLSPFAESLRAKWTKAYLASTAGSLSVIVEQRDSETGGFGSGKTRIDTTFADFLSSVGAGGMYMTTQYGSEDYGAESFLSGSKSHDDDYDDDPVDLAAYRPNPLRPLLPDIAKHIGLRPALLGPLIPQTMNLWLGSTRAPTSSGLHHDFQDNLYVLLRGEKTFTVFSPKDADRMYTNGRVLRVAENGYVHYIPGLRDDGANRHAVATWKVQVAQRKLAAAQAAGKGVETARAELADLVALAAAEDVGSGSDEDGTEFDVGEDSEEEPYRSIQNLTAHATEDDGEDDECDFPGFEAMHDDFEDDSDADVDLSAHRKRSASLSSTSGPAVSAKKPKPEAAPPPSFSRIPVATLHTPTPSPTFPLLAGATKITFTLTAGDALYLPTGWFHEVTSANAKDSKADDAFHMALNYWLAPPTGKTEAEAYEDSYAEDYWRRVEAAVTREVSLS